MGKRSHLFNREAEGLRYGPVRDAVAIRDRFGGLGPKWTTEILICLD